ncbi:hypothetical protein XBKQ1_2870001 [Xenorhabdus bovienii str. kraussei Quebec]|uniref:Uncharacterized protein n=1 Tax=Xenorhabdus bovienii str. kraussei Quebec TaxID=1398203 RepID=A0A077PJS7_XENBV|nr:hypothetical protein XBKQ1_2870001 [Xenorhabdus bovienii str. kraussei Quebec]
MICFDLAINQITKIGLSSLQVIYYFEILFRRVSKSLTVKYDKMLYLIEDSEICQG